MMVVSIDRIKTPSKISLEEFLKLPETKPATDFFEGEIIQKAMPKTEHSRIQSRLSALIDQQGEPLQLVMAFPELRCTFGGGSVVPDIVVLLWSNIPRQANGRLKNEVEKAPDWIIEILSPEQRASTVIKKISFCLNYGTELAWLIDPEDESVTIFRSDRTPEVKENDEVLPALDSLTDWQLTPADMFGWLYI